jgi:hypothetical protein
LWATTEGEQMSIKSYMEKVRAENKEMRELAPKEWAELKKFDSGAAVTVLVVGGVVIALALLDVIDELMIGYLVGLVIGMGIGVDWTLARIAMRRSKEVKASRTDAGA